MDACPFPEFAAGAEPRFVTLVPYAGQPFAPPDEIFFVRAVVEPTREGAIDAAANTAGAGRQDAIACERVGVNDAPWPEDTVPGCPEWLLRPGHWFVAVPYHPWRLSWSADDRTRGSTLRIRHASEDEADARAALAACDVRAMLGRVIYIALGDSGGELGGLQKEYDRLWHGW